MATTSDFKTGLVIDVDGELLSIIEYQHVKPGKGGAFLKTKLKNLKTGRIVDVSFRAGEKINTAFIEGIKYEYLYREDNLFHFMNQMDFEELVLTDAQVGNNLKYLKENTTVNILMYKGNTVGLEMPTFVDLKVTDTEPGVRGDTVSGATKPAALETGVQIQVPLFVDNGDVLRVDTRSESYVERVS